MIQQYREFVKVSLLSFNILLFTAESRIKSWVLNHRNLSALFLEMRLTSISMAAAPIRVLRNFDGGEKRVEIRAKGDIVKSHHGQEAVS
jgi:hypothetical protein